MIAAFATSPMVRIVVAVLAFALIGTAVMQRALHGLEVSPLAARDPRSRRRHGARHAGRRPRWHPIQHPRARAGRVARASRPDDLRGRTPSTPGDGVGGVRPAAPVVERGRGRHAAGLARAAHRLRHPVALATRGRHAARHGTARCASCTRAARRDRQRRKGRGAARVRLAPAGRPRAARGFSPRRHARRARRRHRALPRVGAHAPHRGVRRERRLRPGAVRTLAPPSRAVRPAGGRSRRSSCCSAR